MLAYIRDLWHEIGELIVAIVEGALIRFRPVLMMALPALLGPAAFDFLLWFSIENNLA